MHNNALFSALKAGLMVFYVIALVSSFVPALMPYSNTFLMVLGILVVAHIGEYLMVRKRLAALPSAGANHVINVLLFGVIHWGPLLKSEAKS